MIDYHKRIGIQCNCSAFYPQAAIKLIRHICRKNFTVYPNRIRNYGKCFCKFNRFCIYKLKPRLAESCIKQYHWHCLPLYIQRNQFFYFYKIEPYLSAMNINYRPNCVYSCTGRCSSNASCYLGASYRNISYKNICIRKFISVTDKRYELIYFFQPVGFDIFRHKEIAFFKKKFFTADGCRILLSHSGCNGSLQAFYICFVIGIGAM